ncbi:plasmid partitioning protein RepB [Paracoccus aestuariivivens]|uniref:Plasmid partitioning protein RepB n=1 Tax=Paracoccus aestuariivivens TaxID=1820333 RepID=A0A6L6JBC4_9RHOB|nr:plasmid partitioning protein RepB [Paracoccus aestuariivivens]MTH78515.1 plasmid partitioning protein RepB [Paracoccus aestuariivivens]
MARKDLLKDLMSGPSTSDESRPLPRSDRGAIGAVSKSISELRSRAIIEVQPELIDHAGIRDRLDDDPSGIESLKDSLREYGQQVPVLLRHSPNFEGRYDIVFGRRRVMAMRELNMPVKAMVRTLNDQELVVAQGQENSARKDLSFIEKANFAAQMVKAGFERKVICDALSIDKTVISRMLTVTDAVPEELIQAIGAAPSAGRDRWLGLSQKIQGRSVQDMVEAAVGKDSDSRFAAVLEALAVPRPKSAQQVLRGNGGERLGQAKRGKNKSMIELTGEGNAFGEWLIQNIHEVHRDWLSKQPARGHKEN